MEMAEKIANKLEMITERAFILNNKGFEYIRQDCEEKGKDLFDESYNILIRVKQHEASYALNNIGICQMFAGNYNGAILTLKKALIYQKSYYVQLTANTMLMQCYSLIGDNEKAQIYEDFIRNWLDKHPNSDPAIKRKICMNLSMFLKKNKFNFEAEKYLNKIIDNVTETSSEYRALMLKKEFCDDEIDLNRKYSFPPSKYFNNSLFEPWFITLSHD